METTRPAITATGLSRTYGYRGGGVRAVRDVDLTVAAGSLTALAGPPGAGTSTLLQCLAGTDRGIAGRVVRHGVRLPSGPAGERTRLRAARIAVVGATADERSPRRTGSDAVERVWDAAVADALGRVDRWDGASASFAAARRALVVALAQRPDVVVADEPTADLDAASAASMIDALRGVADRLGITVVVATHDPRLVERAHRVLTMGSGSVVTDSAGAAPSSAPTEPRAAAWQRRLEPAHA